MPDPSRRDALRSIAAAGTLALAGCSGEASHSDEIPRDSGETVPDPEVLFVRDADGGVLFSSGDPSGRTTTPEPGGVEHVTDADERDALAFRDTPPATELEAFVGATDLESESVYLLEQPVGECYELALTGVTREPDSVSADFCRELRPADVECAADAEDTVGVAIRLPFAGDDFNGLGTGMSSECRRRPVLAREGGDGG